MTGFTKTNHIITRTEIQIMPRYYWFAHALSTNIICVAIDSQVCFHKWLFTDPVKPSWCITGPVDPLGSINQNWLGAKLLPMAVSIYPVVCVHPCRLLRAQHHYLWTDGRKDPPSACSPAPTNPPPPHTHSPSYKHHPGYYRGCKKLSQKPAVNTARQS